jgi:hypothetical protein
LDVSGPTLLHAHPDQPRKVLIQIAIDSVLRVQPLLDVRIGRHVFHFLKKGQTARDELILIADGCS